MAQSTARMFYTTNQVLQGALLESEAAIICSNNDQSSSECSSDSCEESDSEPSNDAPLLDASEDADEIGDVDYDEESVSENIADRYHQRNMYTQRKCGAISQREKANKG